MVFFKGSGGVGLGTLVGFLEEEGVCFDVRAFADDDAFGAEFFPDFGEVFVVERALVEVEVVSFSFVGVGDAFHVAVEVVESLFA